MRKEFLEKAENGTLVIGVLGLGYVGLPLAEAYARKNIKVIGYDVNKARVEELASGVSGMNHIEDSRVSSIIKDGLFVPTADPSDLAEADALLICVPTPLDEYHHPDLSYVESTCQTIKKHLRPGQLVVLESTTYPGSTTGVMQPILEESGLVAGKDFALAYSPEREDPGNANYETSTIPKLVGADTEDERAMALAAYDPIVTTVSVPNIRTAEAAKLTENIFRWVNIAMVNELKTIYEKMGIDVWDVIDAAATKPFGFMPFYPGPGVGGHCIRVDPYYLTWKAREFGVSTRFIELAGEININMPRQVIDSTMRELNLRLKKALANSKVLLCGLAYKRDIGDMRESPSLELFELLKEHGADVDYYDPFIPTIPMTRDYPAFAGLESVEWSADKLAEYDVALIATDHTDVDYKLLVEKVGMVVDTRNVTKNLSQNLIDQVVKL